MQKIKDLKISYWNSIPMYIKITVSLLVVLVFVTIALKQTTSVKQKISLTDYDTLINKVLLIKNQAQDISFVLPDMILKQGRTGLQVKIEELTPPLEKLDNLLMNLQLAIGEDVSSLDIKEQDSLYNAYNIINTSIKKLEKIFSLLKVIPQFEDIGTYIEDLQKISKTLSNFPPFYHHKPLEIQHFSLKGQK